MIRINGALDVRHALAEEDAVRALIISLAAAAAITAAALNAAAAARQGLRAEG